MKQSLSSLLTLILLVALISCQKVTKVQSASEESIHLDATQANTLAQLPISCIQTEYPNKLNQTIGSSEDLGSPIELHPAFYGCFDWHSSVHGHWSLVKLLKEFPQLKQAKQAREMLQQNINDQTISLEVDYFQGTHNTSYERTYGWAWLLKLAEELHTWDDPLARDLERSLQPLTDLIVQRYLDFLPKLVYPIRVGEHTNTAFGLSYAWDYAHTVGQTDLKALIEERARDFYQNDIGCPIDWEPSGYDFLSPCLEEVDLMRRVLNEEEFHSWLSGFMPQLMEPGFRLSVGRVSDRTDGKLVHLDGLNFSRAWVFYGLASQYDSFAHLRNVANQHINHSLPNLVGDSYEGGHWLGSFAIYALTTQ